MTTLDDAASAVKRAQERPGYVRPIAHAVGLATYGRGGPGAESPRVLDVAYPAVNLGENPASAALLAEATGYSSGGGTRPLSREAVETVIAGLDAVIHDGQPHLNYEALLTLRDFYARADPEQERRGVVVTFIEDLSAKPMDACDVYLRLHLLSHRKVRPHGLNLEGVFGLLNNVVWTDRGPFEVDDFEMVRWGLRTRGIDLRVRSVDKFPRMTDYVVPSGVRIADADRVRLGAHLAEGTTVMHEGFCNFNAGTLGASMVEGRISAGVVVGNGSDIGGGASIMGTLSGGGKQVVSVGENCLVGANAGIGISLGDNCTVEAGLYVTAGSRVLLPDGRVIKALDLSGQPDLLYRRNSQTGAIEVIPKKSQVVLNEALHQNQ